MGEPKVKQLSEKLRLKDFAFYFSLQVGVVVVCCFGLVLTVIALMKLCFNPLVEQLTEFAAVSYLIVVLFILASSLAYVIGLVGSALENARLLKIAGVILICVAVYWFILMCLSFSGDCILLRSVCVDNRCAERLFIQNGYWRQPIRDCLFDRSHNQSQFNRDFESTTPESLYEDEGDEHAVPEHHTEHTCSISQDKTVTMAPGTWSFPTDEESPSVSPPVFKRLKRAPTVTAITEGRYFQQKEDHFSDKMGESVTASNHNVTELEASTKLSSKSRDHKPKGHRTRGKKLKKGGTRKKEKHSRHQVENKNYTTYEPVGHPVQNGNNVTDILFTNKMETMRQMKATKPTPNLRDAKGTPTNNTEITSSDNSNQWHCTSMIETTEMDEDCSMCVCDCELYKSRKDDDRARHSNYNPNWTPIGDTGKTQHFALSIVYACVILPFWYAYPIWLIFSLAAQIQHGEVV